MYRRRIKRVLDAGLAAIGLVILLPVLGLVAFLVWCDVGRPVIFRQRRPGLRGAPFTLYKFRTMIQPAARDGVDTDEERRLTRLGHVLRSIGLDELPELFNVLKGDMSLIGPRPLLMDYLPLYTPEQARRHEVRPGITGWAQARGRNALNWPEKFALDVWYVDHVSWQLDLKIVAMTLLTLLKREGVYDSGQKSVRRFEGTR